MKPNFALSLSHEGISLLHRAAGGWRTVGEVAIDADNLVAELAVLRKTAAALEPGGVRTKLLIPNDQIKYLSISTPGLSDAARLRAARNALEGATPYDVEDLAFDICSDGAQTHIAAVARETLAEAEAFATEHRFHPVSFVAAPAPGVFTKEPFFGPTQAADALLEGDEKVEQDDTAIVVLDDQTTVEAANAATPPEDAEPEETSPPESAPSLEVAIPADKDAVTVVAAPDGRGAPGDKAAVTAKAASDVSAPGDKDAATLKTASDEDSPADKDPATTTVMTTAAPTPKAAATIDATGSRAGDDFTPVDKDKAPIAAPAAAQSIAVPSPKEATEYKPAHISSSSLDIQPPEPVTAEVAPAPTAFSSRRAPSAPTVGAANRTVPAVPRKGPSAARTPSAPVLTPDSRSLTPAKDVATPKSSTLGFLSRRKPRKTPPPPARGPAIAASSGVVVPKTTSEEEQMTIFGARKSGTVGGKPRFLGLLLTAALLVFLAGVAAWASVFLDDGISLSRLLGSRDTTTVASAPPDEAAPPAQIDIGQPPVSLVKEPTVTASLDPSLSDEDGAVLDALRVPELTQPRDMTLQEIEAKYATSGVWPIAPDTPEAPATVPLDDLYITSIDPVSKTSDAVALPTLASLGGDTFEFSPASPAAPGTVFSVNDQGLVSPSTQGTLNQDGVLVYLGQPPLTPPQRATQAEEPTVAALVTDRTPLLDFRPKLRPGGLVENNERSELDGLTRVELAAFRPALRPASAQQTAAAVPAPEVTAAAAAAGASLAALPPVAAPNAINNASAFAVAASKRPDTRPNDFARIVKRAARADPEPATEPTKVASSAAVAPRNVAPSLPSKASVAKQATVTNAIMLRDINLIGVYGKPSSRRALIRLSNGRYQKVAVGDKLDGGRVSAIGDTELRYTRRGRDVVLKMPRG